MKQNKFMQWLINNKKGLIIGFIFGIVAPYLAIVLAFFIPGGELLRPLLIGPMDMINVYSIPQIISFVFNGVCYALLGGFIQSYRRLKKQKKPIK